MDALFGSETRARTLELLATTSRPLPANRIARAIGAEPIQVLRILRSLQGTVDRNERGWVLADGPLRAFLRNRVAREAIARREEKDELLVRFGLRPSSDHGRR